MPEGDTIFRAAHVLHAALAGRVVTRFESAYAQLAAVDDDRPVAGRTVEKVEAVGKHLLVHLTGDLVLRTHMRMNGSWHLYRRGERWRRPARAMRVLLETDLYQAVGFDVPVAEFLRASDLPRHAPVAELGPDLLALDFDAAEAERRLRARAAVSCGEALLDQHALAGIGNVFKSEILFACGVHPDRLVGSLTDDELRRILQTARRQLTANAPRSPTRWDHAGGRRTTDRLKPDEALWVYGRAGEPCRRCGTPIVLTRQGEHARLTYHCPGCQADSAQHGTSASRSPDPGGGKVPSE